MLYAITNRRLYGMDEASRRSRLLELAALWAANGVAFIQLREKDLAGHDQVELARAMLQIIRAARVRFSLERATRLLINGRPDVALAAGADGVHLPAGPDVLAPEDVRSVFTAAGRAHPVISISCHTLPEVEAARRQKADCILFAPVFEKVVTKDLANSSAQRTLPGTGLTLLAEACRVAAPIPIYALGGVTTENAAECLEAGAAGIAAIRLLQKSATVWAQLM